jgi:hypothetical protein
MPRGRACLARHPIFNASPETRLLRYLTWRSGAEFDWPGHPPTRADVAPLLGTDPVDRAQVARWAREDLLSAPASVSGRTARERASHVHHLLYQRNQLERAAICAAPRDSVYRSALFVVTDQLISTFCVRAHRRRNP